MAQQRKDCFGLLSKKPLLNPISVTLTYAALATLWIWSSDSLILRLGLSPDAIFRFSTVKGTLFVGVTTLVLYLLLKRMVTQIAGDAKEKRFLERQFQQAQRMEALGQLAANVSHDVKNHLMVISGYAELLELKDEQNCARRDVILKAVAKCDKLSRELLAYSRRQPLTPIPVKVRDTVSETASMLSTALGRSITQVTRINTDSAILIDPSQLQQVLMNLAMNSKDAMPSGGTFCLEASDLAVNSEVDGVVVPEGNYVQLVITDSGHGVPERYRSRLFEPFFTTKERGKGTGLGLAAVYGITKQSGGFIFVDSQPGQGTSFRLLFPKLESPGVHQ
jgi:two-component system cell cycle sensor histidine kinase/response regulator CckA